MQRNRDESSDLKVATRTAKQKRHDTASDDLRVVAITCNPAPDAQDRLRRLFTILARLAEDDKPSPASPSPDDDPAKAD